MIRSAAEKRIIRLTALAAAALFCAVIFAGCRSPRVDPVPTASVIDIPTGTDGAETAVTPEPTPAPTAEPDSLEGKILAGLIYPLNGGKAIKDGWAGEDVDVDGDGVPNALRVKDTNGGPTFCIDGEPFLDVGSSIMLASLDGEHIVFVVETKGVDGYRVFYPDPDGNLYCRLFAIARSGSADGLVIRSSVEEYIRNGLDVMLHNPMLYSRVNGDRRHISLDMDGDGSPDEIVFDSAVLSVNGSENGQILLTTMPRFIYDSGRDAIVLYGSAGDYALRLRYEGGSIVEEISYATLL